MMIVTSVPMMIIETIHFSPKWKKERKEKLALNWLEVSFYLATPPPQSDKEPG